LTSEIADLEMRTSLRGIGLSHFALHTTRLRAIQNSYCSSFFKSSAKVMRK
jgi:hypothetical protein